jgi:hypothetical protein
MEKTLKLIGSRILKIDSERNPNFKGKIDMKNNIKINNIEKVSSSKESLQIKKASVKAIQFEEELGLPIHLRLPSISINNQK